MGDQRWATSKTMPLHGVAVRAGTGPPRRLRGRRDELPPSRGVAPDAREQKPSPSRPEDRSAPGVKPQQRSAGRLACGSPRRSICLLVEIQNVPTVRPRPGELSGHESAARPSAAIVSRAPSNVRRRPPARRRRSRAGLAAARPRDRAWRMIVAASKGSPRPGNPVGPGPRSEPTSAWRGRRSRSSSGWVAGWSGREARACTRPSSRRGGRP